MHENANVTFNTKESLNLMSTLLSLQPRSAGGGSGKTSDTVRTLSASSVCVYQPRLCSTGTSVEDLS